MENAVTPETGAGEPVNVVSALEERFSKQKSPPTETEAEPVETEQAEAGAEETGREDDEPEAEEEGQEEPIYSVKVDGQEIEVTLDELLKGYSRERDYTRKTMEFGEERRRFEAEKSQLETKLNGQLQTLQALTADMETELLADFKDVDFAALKRDYPEEYLIKKDELEERLERLNRVKAKANEAGQHLSAEQQRRMSQYVAEQMEKLPQIVPEFAERKVFEENVPLMRGYLETSGYAREEIDALVDARALGLIWKAMKYDKLKAARPEAEKKVKNVPKYVKPGTKTVKHTNQKALEQNMQRLRNGDQTASVALLEQRFGKRK